MSHPVHDGMAFLALGTWVKNSPLDSLKPCLYGGANLVKMKFVRIMYICRIFNVIFFNLLQIKYVFLHLMTQTHAEDVALYHVFLFIAFEKFALIYVEFEVNTLHLFY